LRIWATGATLALVSHTARSILQVFESALGGPSAEVDLPDGGSLPSAFAVGDLAQASMAAAAGTLASLISSRTGRPAPRVTVDRELASAWFAASIRPQGWRLLPAWDAIAGDYRAGDGWIKIHTNAPHHRARAIEVLDVEEDRDAVASAVGTWTRDELETAIVEAGGAAAAMHSLDEWRDHPQGLAVAAEPLVYFEAADADRRPDEPIGSDGQPLKGAKVLDLTRVLAGPVATRLLAGWGAEVLRIDPPDWDEPAIVPEVTLGKRCARLDLRVEADRDRFVALLSEAHIVVSGYRSDALERLGLGPDERQRTRPGLIDVSLDAYGWTGPWARRRGFDSLVQMSSGIADAGMKAAGARRPTPLPVQALDHATGYLLAGAAISGLAYRRREGRGSTWRTSLASMAQVLIDAGMDGDGLEDTWSDVEIRPEGPTEKTYWGDALRLPPPVHVQGAPLRWDLPASPLGSDRAAWLST
jgi:crotonobetainyl-CoA:carnitine CoA-transferase CaiB-like acyl-CoA transferase